MKKITFILFAFITGTTFAQLTPAASAVVSTDIVEAITVTNTNNTVLSFGNIASPAGITPITVSTDGTRDEVTGITIAGGTVASSAQFDIVAGASLYNINLSAPALQDGTGAGVEMALALDPDLDIATTHSGSKTLNVGGTLTVGADQVAGNYTSTIDVTVAYQ